jgi:hypothetical protein
MKTLLLSLLLAWSCYAPTPLFFAQNGASAAASSVNPDDFGTVAWFYDLATESYSDGASISLLNDLRGSYDLAQGTVAKQPIFDADGIGGLPSANFDGIDDVLSVTGTPGVQTIVCVVRFVSGTANAVWADGVTSMARTFFYNGAGANTYTSPPANSTDCVMVIRRIAGVSLDVFINGTKETFAAGPYAMSGTLKVGQSTFYANVRIGWHCGFTDAVNDVGIAALTTDLKKQFAIP